MAKELPYFKFTCSDWDSGNIQICSMEAQGLFMNICSLYWTRLGRLPVKLAKQRICKGYASAYQELIDEGVIKEQNDLIVIEFLDEQLSEFEDNSEKRRQAARARWDKANAMQVHSKSNAIREDKRREEEIREDNSIINSPNGESELTKKQQYEFLFDEFWKLYDKKTGREPSKRKWMKLKEKEIEQIFQHVPKYVSSTPDKQYRQNPLTYLNQKSYENEIIEQNGKRSQLSFSERHAQAIRQYHEGGIGNNNSSQFGDEVSGIFGETL